MSPSRADKQPTTWDDYDRGGRSSSIGSNGSHVRWDELERQTSGRSSHLAPLQDEAGERDLRRRRSSMSIRISALRQAGGVNSFDNFARSWQRAAGFHEIAPVQHQFRTESEQDEEGRIDGYRREDYYRDTRSSPGEGRSLLRDAFSGRQPPEDAVADEEGAHKAHAAPNDHDVSQRLLEGRRRDSRGESIIPVEPSLASPFGGSYGTKYGSVASRADNTMLRSAGRLFREQQASAAAQHPDKEREPLILKSTEEDGVTYQVVVGHSTVPQTIFNSVNVLIGVGLLSLPLAIHYSGWVVGVAFFFFAVVSTQYTAKLLAKCLDVDNSLITFADLAYVSFGPYARIATSVIFTIELLGANVALVVLFADSLDALVGGYGVLAWKLVCGVILIPLSFMPLRLLSFTSILGILSCFTIVLAIFVDGFIKPHKPGSLREPATTYLFPEHWGTVPLSLGLLMSPWGGHSVFPNIYRDMRHPYKYRHSVNVTYTFTFFLDFAMAVAGYLMFGDLIRDEVTSNILLTKGYPKWISVVIVVSIAIIPLTKVPLNARPIISTVEILVGLDPRAISTVSESSVGMSSYTRGVLKITIRVLTVAAFIAIAIVFPSFDRIMTLLGSVCCFTICIILPLAFHLKLFGKELGQAEILMNWVLIVVSTIMAVVSTAFAFFPKEFVEQLW